MSPPRDEDTTVNYTPQLPAPEEPRATAPESLTVDAAGFSHLGHVRANNEDHFLIARFGRSLEILGCNLPPGEVASEAREIGYGMLVADGMGGQAAGEEASRSVIRNLVGVVLTTPDWILFPDDDFLAAEMIRRTSARFEKVNESLTRQAVADPSLQGFGTTLTLAWSLGRDLYLAHVGDSRAYLWRDETLHQLTHDHTVAQALADGGSITEDEASTHRMRNVLVRFLGEQGDAATPDVSRLKLHDGDCVLLCTDGLSEMIDDQAISQLLRVSESSQETSRKLVNCALDAGGRDNVTVVVVRYKFS